MINLNLGSGKIRKKDYTNIDRCELFGDNGKRLVDIVLDIENDLLPFEDGIVDNILVDSVLEHMEKLKFVLNECWRVLKVGGRMEGCVPVAGTEPDYKDPTHKRHFIKKTFSYFDGSYPRYSEYGIKPWIIKELDQRDDIIYFVMKPRK